MRALLDDVGNRIVVLLVVVAAVVQVDLEALEPVVHDEVHDSGDRIGAVDCRCAAGQQLDALDQRHRDLVEVSCVTVLASGLRTTRRQTAAIDEH